MLKTYIYFNVLGQDDQDDYEYEDYVEHHAYDENDAYRGHDSADPGPSSRRGVTHLLFLAPPPIRVCLGDNMQKIILLLFLAPLLIPARHLDDIRRRP